MPPTDAHSSTPTLIYLIEDDPSVQNFVRRALMLRPDWALVGHSSSLGHAQAHAASAKAKVYLVDLGLPDGRGEEALRALSQAVPGAELLVFTVFGDESRLVGAIESGATGYVLKGCAEYELIDAIAQILAGGTPISSQLARLLLKRLRPPAGAPTPPVTVVDSQEAAPDTQDEPEKASLSSREFDVLKLVAQGYVNKEIARKLDISAHTVGSHIKNLYGKLAVHSRTEVVWAAQRQGLL